MSELAKMLRIYSKSNQPYSKCFLLY